MCPNYPSAFRAEALELYLSGLSYRGVARLTNKSQGTAVAHRTIRLWAQSAGIGRSLSDASRLSPSARAHISSLGRANAIPVKPGYRELSKTLAYIVGVVMGDGYLGKYDVRLDTIDLEFARAFRMTLIRKFGRKPTLNRKREHEMVSPINGKTYLCKPYFNFTLVSKATVDFLSSIQTEAWVRSLPLEYKIDWLRGIWDAEGAVSRSWKGKARSWRVGFFNTEERIARLFADLVEEVTGIHLSIRYGQGPGWSVWTVGFGRLPDVVKFADILAPTIRRKQREFKRAKVYFASRYPIFSIADLPHLRGKVPT